MDTMVALRILTICTAILFPILYYIFSTSIKRACLLLSITISIQLSLEFLYFSASSWLYYHRFFVVVGIGFGCCLIQFCRIQLIKYIFKSSEPLFHSHLQE